MILSGCLLAISAAVSAQTESNTYFQYPTVPESIVGLTERTDYVLEHFWDRCNINEAFSSLQKMKGAFSDYVGLMPYGSAEMVKTSINNLISKVAKNPRNLLALGEMAEAALYSDSAEVVCDECYLPFAQAVAANKKISKAEKARFEYQAKVLGGAQVGMTAPDFTYTTPDGKTGKLSDIPAGSYVLIFINDPDCDHCELARVRLSADINLNDLIDRSLVKVVSVYPGDFDPDWAERAASYSDRWIVGASPEVGDSYDLRNPPVLYYLNGEHKILSKSLVIDGLLEGFRRAAEKTKTPE